MAENSRRKGPLESEAGAKRRAKAKAKRKQKSDAIIKRLNANRLKPTKSQERQKKLEAMRKRQRQAAR